MRQGPALALGMSGRDCVCDRDLRSTREGPLYLGPSRTRSVALGRRSATFTCLIKEGEKGEERAGRASEK